MVASPPLFLFISCFGVPEPRIELGAALQQHDALPVGYVATLQINFIPVGTSVPNRRYPFIKMYRYLPTYVGNHVSTIFIVRYHLPYTVPKVATTYLNFNFEQYINLHFIFL